MDTGEEFPEEQATPRLCKPRHPMFYFRSGDVVFVCEDTSFRVQSDLLSCNSQVFSGMLERGRLDGVHLRDGCPCVHLSDAAEDFATLLRVFYTPGCVRSPPCLGYTNTDLLHCRFPHRRKTPDFATFSSLLRMTTKYQFKELRSQILLDLLPAYPTKLSEYEKSSCRGETVFGSPTPHPHSVLNLFLACNVGFALPFAYYRACIAGDPASFATSAEEAALPPDTLEMALRGQARLKREEVGLAKKVAFRDCAKGGELAGRRAEVFNWIHPGMVTQSGILERGEFKESKYCAPCSQSCVQELSEAKENTWENLPSYFGLPPWETTVP